MSEQLRESMSAVMDDEADAFELRRVLDEASQDDGLREQWHRMHMVRDALRDQGAGHQASTETPDPAALRAAIWRELEAPAADAEVQEPLQLVDETPRATSQRPNWLGRLTGTAVAAVVAGLVVVNGGFLDTDRTGEDSLGEVVAVNPLGPQSGLIRPAAGEDPTAPDAPLFTRGQGAGTSVTAGADNVRLANGAATSMYDQATELDRHRQDALRMLHYQTNAVNNAGAVSFVRMATFGRSPAGTRRAVGQPSGAAER